MHTTPPPDPKEQDGLDPAQVAIAGAVRRSAGTAVRRAVAPVLALIVGGIAEFVQMDVGQGVLLVGGALSCGLVMLAYAVQTVRIAMGRAAGAWGPIFWFASWIPYVMGTYVTFVLGLRTLSSQGLGMGGMQWTLTVLYTVFGGLLLRAQWKLSEVHRLAKTMSGIADELPGGVR